jgi:hypothetical protein
MNRTSFVGGLLLAGSQAISIIKKEEFETRGGLGLPIFE